jgi:hypothetical protein
MTTEQLSDAELAGQPAAYWTGVAYEALIAYIRARQADKGYTQPSSGCCATCRRTTSRPPATG